MNTRMWKLCLFLGLLMIVSESARADVLEVTPVQAIVLPSEAGMIRVALLYDLTGMRSGTGRRIDEAILDWRISGIPAEETTTYRACAVRSAWTEAGIISGVSAPEMEENPVSKWRVEPPDYERNQGGFLRFNLTSIARKWDTGVQPNYGIVISTPDVDAEVFSSQLNQAVLTVRYGFRAQ